ncbi:S24 family peptidase [Tabrizicola flagellatus]|uniref:S24 family peptidase n=1 Tax=Tabrizicola flagellatus TaxID=2593021 RepID=UPI0011F3A2F8|nr:S24 family peptidase [Tabrizicola flagellatus]
MDAILDIIDQALKRKGLSDSAASKLAVGHPSLLKNMRMPREGEKRYNLPSLMRLAEVLDLEFYFGPRRPAEPVGVVEISGEDYARVPVHDAWLSAGPGVSNGEAAVIDHLLFRQDWLRKIGVRPDSAALARISGDSMAPAIQSGDLVLIDTARREVPEHRPDRPVTKLPILAFIQEGEARVKRLERRPSERLLVLYSDNRDIPPEVISDRDAHLLNILGRVAWSGHVWR